MAERHRIAPTFNEALAVWAKVGVLSFGGPAGQIALMHRVLVDERKWIGEQQFMHALNFCMLLPGPEAMQLATYIGWRLHGTLGGLAAGLLFVFPGALVVLALSIAYALAIRHAIILTFTSFPGKRSIYPASATCSASRAISSNKPTAAGSRCRAPIRTICRISIPTSWNIRETSRRCWRR
jgi:hypothetical protein